MDTHLFKTLTGGAINAIKSWKELLSEAVVVISVFSAHFYTIPGATGRKILVFVQG